ncbi:N-6 DNA methylase [Pantoea agglomerans]
MAIIGVASNLFYGTGIPASILVLRKSRPTTHKDHV